MASYQLRSLYLATAAAISVAGGLFGTFAWIAVSSFPGAAPAITAMDFVSASISSIRRVVDLCPWRFVASVSSDLRCLDFGCLLTVGLELARGVILLFVVPGRRDLDLLRQPRPQVGLCVGSGVGGCRKGQDC